MTIAECDNRTREIQQEVTQNSNQLGTTIHYEPGRTYYFTSEYLLSVVSRKYAPPFATLGIVQNARGAYTRDAMISLAITPSLPLRPTFRYR